MYLIYGRLTENEHDEIKGIACKAAGCSYYKFHAGVRTKDAINARFIYISYLIKNGVPSLHIEKHMRGKNGHTGFDHSNCLYAKKSIDEWMQTEKQTKKLVETAYEKMDKVFYNTETVKEKKVNPVLVELRRQNKCKRYNHRSLI